MFQKYSGKLGELLVNLFDAYRSVCDSYDRDVYEPGSKAARARQVWHLLVSDIAIELKDGRYGPAPDWLISKLKTIQVGDIRIQDLVHYYERNEHRQIGYTRPSSYTGDLHQTDLLKARLQ